MLKRSTLLAALLAITAGSPTNAQGVGNARPFMLPPSPKQKTSDLSLLLGLRADQAGALRSLVEALEPPPPPPGERRDRERGNGLDEPPFVADPLTRMARRLEQDRSRLTQLSQFRASLDKDQQKRFDALLRVSDRLIGGPMPPPRGDETPNRPGAEGPPRG